MNVFYLDDLKHRKEKPKKEKVGKNFEIQVVQVPIFRVSFRIFNLRWRVQNLVFLSPADMIDQGNQLEQVSQCK